MPRAGAKTVTLGGVLRGGVDITKEFLGGGCGLSTATLRRLMDDAGPALRRFAAQLRSQG